MATESLSSPDTSARASTLPGKACCSWLDVNGATITVLMAVASNQSACSTTAGCSREGARPKESDHVAVTTTLQARNYTTPGDVTRQATSGHKAPGPFCYSL